MHRYIIYYNNSLFICIANKNGLQLKAVFSMVERLREERGTVIIASTASTSGTTQPTSSVTGDQTTKGTTQGTTQGTTTAGAATTRVPSQNILGSYN